jgi:CrcB protein
MTALAVGVGGALGALARYWVSGWVQAAAGGSFPWGTLAVNVTGSLLLGFLVVWLQAAMTAPELRALLTIGVLGSFTTFSTFSYETAALLQDGEWTRAGLYVAGSLLVGLVGVLLGAASADLLLQPRG